jgi:hypothetical protein
MCGAPERHAGIRCAHFSYCNHNRRGSGLIHEKIAGVDCMMR